MSDIPDDAPVPDEAPPAPGSPPPPPMAEPSGRSADGLPEAAATPAQDNVYPTPAAA